MDCKHHDWASARTDDQTSVAFVGSPSIVPAAFFPSKHVNHCASSIMHDMRRDRCHLSGFETFLCCRSCTLSSDCWTSDELAKLPCGSHSLEKKLASDHGGFTPLLADISDVVLVKE
jgi:hypothetical protein